MNEKQANTASPRILVDIGNSVWKAIRSTSSTQAATAPSFSLEPLDVHRFTRSTHRVADANATPALQPSDQDSVEHRQAVERWINELSLGSENPLEWMVSSVSTPAMRDLYSSIKAARPFDRWYEVHRDWIAMPIRVDSPDRLGIDRLLAAWGAWHYSEQQGPLIVVQVGTAVTVDYVSEDGSFCGGAIFPSMPLSLRTLSAGTDRLPSLLQTSQLETIPFPGRNTQEAMRGGVLASVVGGIDWLCAKYQSLSGQKSRLIVSGGDSPAFLGLLAMEAEYVDHLVMRALLAISRERPALEDFAG